MFTFSKLTDAEEKSFQLLEAGTYEFQVIEAKSGDSKSGNPMITLTLVIFDRFGNKHALKDWLVSKDNAMCKKKIRDFCFATGLQHFYDNGQLTEADIVQKRGECNIDTEIDPKGVERNKIMNYVPDATKRPYLPLPMGRPQLDAIDDSDIEDAIPF
jgi:hypothetical protein